MLLSDAVGAVRAVRLLLLSDVGLLLSGAVRWCCRGAVSSQALTHTSHTYDIIKRRPAGLCCTYSSLYSASGPTIFFMVDVTIFLSAALRE